MKYVKILFAIALVFTMCSAFSLKKDHSKPVYAFGISASFTDTVVYFTDIQILDSAKVSKEGFLSHRELYSYQLKNYLEFDKGLPNRTCMIYFSENKKKLGKEHDQIERTLFTAIGYWTTDLTAFVNIWDTIDDRICSLITKDHTELGGYVLGNIGGIARSNGFINNIPKFHKMCMELHQLRLHSHLSHSEIKGTHQYTGPIPQNKRKTIIKLINEGVQELIQFW